MAPRVKQHPGFDAMAVKGKQHPGFKAAAEKDRTSSGIHIDPAHKGLLTKEVGKAGLSVGNLRKEIADDKKTGNVAKEKREVFALNAKTKFHHDK